jgi:hypothetical protein
MQLFNLNMYFKSVLKYGSSFCLSTKQSIELFFNELIKTGAKTSLTKNLIEFYRSYDDFCIKIDKILGYYLIF